LRSLTEFFTRSQADPVFLVTSLLPKAPHPGQAMFLREARSLINVLVPGNRWGKSTVIAMRHIWHAFTKHGRKPQGKYTWTTMPYETISISASADQALIVFSEVKRLLSHPAIAPFVTSIRSTPFPTITLWNGAVINCRSAHDDGKYIDGHEYAYVSIDEAGHIDDLKKLMNGVIIMRLAGGGMIDLVGTPKGMSSNGLYWYWNRAARGVDGYYGQRGSVFDNIFLPAEDVKRRDELLLHSDPRLRDQVIYGNFVSEAGMAFTQEELDNLFDPDLPAHQPWRDGHTYLQAWDLGRKTDYTVGITLDVTEEPYELVDYQRLNRVGWETIYSLIQSKAKEYHVDLPRVDATGPQGDVVVEELWKRGIRVDDFKVSTGIIKTNLINNLQQALSKGRPIVGMRDVLDEAMILHQTPDMAPPDSKARGEKAWGLIRLPAIPQLLDEMGGYMIDDKDLVQDSVQSLALVTDLAYSGGILYAPIGGSIYDS
jgi:hypothetical protein